MINSFDINNLGGIQLIMKRSNIKRVLAAIGIITIATIGFSVSDVGGDDVSEAEVTESVAPSVVEVSTTSPKTVDIVPKKSVSASSKIYTSMTTQKKVEQVTESVTTKKPVVSTETKTEKKVEPTTQKKVAEKKTESKKPITEKATESTEKKHVTSDVKKNDPVEPVQEETNDIKKDAKINEELLTSDGQKIVAELESETQKEEEKESGKSEFGYTLQYSAVYNVTTGHLTRSNGSIRYNGHRETWYSTNEAAGKNTAVSIPGKHVADDGTIRDADGYVCVASSDLAFYSTVMTSVGPGKVYDCGCSHGTIDVYTNW